MLRSQALPGLRKFKVLPSIPRLGMQWRCGTLSIGLYIPPRHLWPEPRNCLVSGFSLEPHILPQNLSAGIFPSSAASIPNSGTPSPSPHSSSCLRGWLAYTVLPASVAAFKLGVYQAQRRRQRLSCMPNLNKQQLPPCLHLNGLKKNCPPPSAYPAWLGHG